MSERGKTPRSSVSCDWLRAREVAEMLGVSEDTVRDKAARGQLPQPRRLGPRWVRWHRVEIEQLLGLSA
jgi:excisionase family DNA binding protein